MTREECRLMVWPALWGDLIEFDFPLPIQSDSRFPLLSPSLRPLLHLNRKIQAMPQLLTADNLSLGAEPNGNRNIKSKLAQASHSEASWDRINDDLVSPLINPCGPMAPEGWIADLPFVLVNHVARVVYGRFERDWDAERSSE